MRMAEEKDANGEKEKLVGLILQSSEHRNSGLSLRKKNPKR